MAYTKTVWQDGDVITAQKMNKIENALENIADYIVENGIGGGGAEPLIIHETDNESANILDKTWKEIHDAFLSGKSCILDASYSYNGSEYIQNYPLSYIGYNPNAGDISYSVIFGGEYDSREYYTSNENDYPSDL